MTYPRVIYRYPKGDEDERHPKAGWWLDIYRDLVDPSLPELNFGPFETMQDAVDFRDANWQ